jgi:DNA end-binding protein Ku
MARAIWTGSISFGLLNVPVKLYSAVSSRSISFRELREGDNSRIRHRRVAEDDGEEVPYERIVKGYEIAPDQYVILERSELEDLAPKKTKAIQIEAFVDLDEIDPIYFDRPYYVGPQMGAERAYALLVEAMREQRKVAIARFVMRNKESLAAIRATGDVLTLATMRFADDVMPPEQLDGLLGEDTEVEPNPKEVEMAKALIDSLSQEFEPGQFKDEYRDELLALIERKARGEDVVSVDAEAPKPTKAPDLMAALEESLAAVKSEELGGGKPSARKRPTKRSTGSKSGGKGGSGKTTKTKAKSKSRSGTKGAK